MFSEVIFNTELLADHLFQLGKNYQLIEDQLSTFKSFVSEVSWGVYYSMDSSIEGMWMLIIPKQLNACGFVKTVRFQPTFWKKVLTFSIVLSGIGEKLAINRVLINSYDGWGDPSILINYFYYFENRYTVYSR